MLIPEDQDCLRADPALPFQNFKELEGKIETAEVISFDFFDTLFVRTLLEPEDVFDVIGKRFGIDNFRALRQKAQAEAFLRMRQAKLKEITLDGIYSCFDRFGKFPVEQLKQAEYEIELAVLHPNSELAPVFINALASGKRVVVTSDMYLPVDFFQESFRLNKLEPVPFFISATCNATKRDRGELFDVVASKLDVPHNRILHIGDNPLSDIKQAKAKGLETFHYAENRRPQALHRVVPETSLGYGLLRKHRHEIPEQSYKELGFVYGGPAAAGFLDWITEQAKKDRLDHVLFLARDGYVLNSIAHGRTDINLPAFTYFLGSRTVFTLAAITEVNFPDFLPFLLSGADGLSPFELLERIGVTPPDDKVMLDLGLGSDVRVHPGIFDQLESFLYAYRWEILKVCRRNRHALFCYLHRLGIRDGARVALVDVGWNGTTQSAFEDAIKSFLNIEVFGYYFCLSGSRECLERQKHHHMSAFISPESTSWQMVDSIYNNRVVIELFFSAPHGSVIGLDASVGADMLVIEDNRNAGAATMADASRDILKGMEIFGGSYRKAVQELGMPMAPAEMAMPLIDFAINGHHTNNALLNSLNNFDAWSYSRNRDIRLSGY